MLKLYITDLAAYNAGKLIGSWVDTTIEQEEFDSKIKDILDEGTRACNDTIQHEEVFITDWEFESIEIFKINEHDSIPAIKNIIDLLLESVEEHQYRIIKFLLDNFIVNSVEEAIEKVDDVIIYENMDMKQVAEEYLELVDLSDVPDLIKHNIDFQGIAIDLEMDGTYYPEDGNVYQFLG